MLIIPLYNRDLTPLLCVGCNSCRDGAVFSWGSSTILACEVCGYHEREGSFDKQPPKMFYVVDHYRGQRGVCVEQLSSGNANVDMGCRPPAKLYIP